MMFWRTVLPVARLWLVLWVASAQLSVQQKDDILKLHNQYRASVSPRAANMKRMLWDESLSQIAAQYAAVCRWDHNPSIYGVFGENLFLTLGPLIISQPLQLWYDESAYYDISSASCAAGKTCGHYTQMVWANTNFVGCASQFCSNVSNFNAKNATILVCNYYPAGNIMGQPAYTEGSSCAACPKGTIRCTNNYCDQGANLTLVSTVGNISTLLTSANMLNVTPESSAGFTGPSVAPLLLAALTAFYMRMT